MKRGRWPGKGVGAWRGHPAELGSPDSVRRKRDCARSGSRRELDGTGGRAGGLALSVTAPSGPVLPGRRCPWMRPPRAPRPVSVPGGPALECSLAPAQPLAAASSAPGARARRSPPPAGASTPRAEAAPALWPRRGRRAGDGGPGPRAPCRPCGA